MHKYHKLLTNIRFTIRKYDEIVVYVSIVMSIALQFIPDSFTWKNDLLIISIYTGVVAIIFVVLDIQYSIKEKENGILFRNMFDAKETIFTQIENVRKRKDVNEVLEIFIIGLKLRAISAILHELLNEVEENNLVLFNTKFIVYYFDPDSFENLISPQTPNDIAEELRQKYDEFKIIVKTNVRELSSYNKRGFFKSKNIIVESYSYNSTPSFWGFGIDRKLSFVGPFTWNKEKYIFIGPQNPCVMVDEDELGNVILSYINNRRTFFDEWNVKDSVEK